MRDAHGYRAAIGHHIVDPVGDSDPDGIGAEIVVVHESRQLAPSGSRVFEITYEFAFLKFRHGRKRDEILELLESHGVQPNEHHQAFRVQMAPDMFKEKAQMFVQIAQLNKEWWVG